MRLLLRFARRASVFVPAVLLSLAVSLPAQAQPGQQRLTESNSDVFRTECAAARAAFTRDGRITPANAPRVLELRRCRESAGAVLPIAWRSARADSGELSTLLGASSGIRDSRITHVLETILNDTTKDDLVRAAAASALSTIVFNGIAGYVRTSEIAGTRWVVSISLVTHLEQEDGPNVPEASLKVRLIQTFEGYAATSARRTPFQVTMNLLAGYLKLSR